MGGGVSQGFLSFFLGGEVGGVLGRNGENFRMGLGEGQVGGGVGGGRCDGAVLDAVEEGLSILNPRSSDKSVYGDRS